MAEKFVSCRPFCTSMILRIIYPVILFQRCLSHGFLLMTAGLYADRIFSTFSLIAAKTTNMKKLIVLIYGILFCSLSVSAAYVSFSPYTITQPDGKVIHCFVSGDEIFNWLHDAEGYTIIQAPDGFYYYGKTSGKEVVPTQHKAGEVEPSTVGIPKWAKIPLAEYQRRRAVQQYNPNPSIRAPHSGTLNNLVIYIRFSDDTEFTSTRQYYDDKFNLLPGISMKSYYLDVSYNQLNISSTHYPECPMTTNLSYQDSHPRSYFQPYNASTNPNGYSGESERTYREHNLLKDAVDWVNINSPVPAGLNLDGDNDGNIDNVGFIIRGSNGAWATLLWAHSWVLYSYSVYINGKRLWEYTFQPETQNNVTILCHEMFHAIGAPDLYHYSYDGLQPAQNWDLMEQGSGHMGAYMKWKYSNNTWISSIPQITVSGTYTLNPLTSATNNCYKIASPNSSTEYFVVEYRNASGNFESTLPGSGLLVYRINPVYNGNANGPPDEVYIYRPNGTTTVNGSPGSAYFSSSSGRTAINDLTNPSSFLTNGTSGGLDIFNVTSAGSTISFSININNIGVPSTFTATPVSSSQINLQWTKNISGDNVMLAWSTSSSIGIPVSGTSYSPGNSIPGGGTVLYNGSGTSFNHSGLDPNTRYYYKLWSVTSSNLYSSGTTQNASTLCTSASLPYSQNFPSEVLPECWSTQVSGAGTVNNWNLSNTSNAGGSPFELKSTFQNVISGTTRLVMPPINTTNMTSLTLGFRHMLDDYGPGATLRIQSSTDGINWTNEAWSLATSSDNNVGPAIVSTPITSNLNAPVTYVAFTITGNLFQYDYWYIDNVTVTGLSSLYPIVTTTPVSSIGETSATSGGNVTFQGASSVTARGVCWSTYVNPTISSSYTTDGTGTGSFSSSVNGLSPSTYYHLRAYATNSYGTSYGDDIVFSTLCGAITSFPWNEGFEHNGILPSCWTQEQVNSSGINWQFGAGNGAGNPVSAHTGSYNAYLKDQTSSSNRTRLITPPLNLSGLGNPQLSFWHTQAAWGSDQDQLTVYYRISASDPWVLLAVYTSSITSWTQETLSLPSSTSTYYIAFEGNAKFGFGVCLDDVSVTGESIKTVNLTLFLQGLYTGNSTMRASQDESGFHWGQAIADKLTIELHDGLNYSNLIYTLGNVSLSTNGLATFTVPASLAGNYYLSVQHRNHLLTVSANPVSFSSSNVNYSFDSPSKAYGGNMELMVDGRYVFYAGDVSHDGLVDGSDLTIIGNQNDVFATGYLTEDINGDGLIDGSDLTFASNNNEIFISSMTP